MKAVVEFFVALTLMACWVALAAVALLVLLPLYVPIYLLEPRPSKDGAR